MLNKDEYVYENATYWYSNWHHKHSSPVQIN